MWPIVLSGIDAYNEHPETERRIDASKFNLKDFTCYFDMLYSNKSPNDQIVSLRNSNDIQEVQVTALANTGPWRRATSAAFTPNNSYPSKRISGTSRAVKILAARIEMWGVGEEGVVHLSIGF